MKVIIDTAQINVYAQNVQIRNGNGKVDELEELKMGRTFLLNADYQGKEIPAHVLYSKEGEFGDGVLRLSYEGKNLLDASSMTIEASKEGLERLSLKKGSISTSETPTNQRLIMWSPYSDMNVFKKNNNPY